MGVSERMTAEQADTYRPGARDAGARRAARHVSADLGFLVALIIGPLAVVLSRVEPGARSPAVAATLLALVVGGVTLGALPDAGVDPDERRQLARRRRIALAVMIVALASMFVIVRAG